MNRLGDTGHQYISGQPSYANTKGLHMSTLRCGCMGFHQEEEVEEESLAHNS